MKMYRYKLKSNDKFEQRSVNKVLLKREDWLYTRQYLSSFFDGPFEKTVVAEITDQETRAKGLPQGSEFYSPVSDSGGSPKKTSADSTEKPEDKVVEEIIESVEEVVTETVEEEKKDGRGRKSKLELINEIQRLTIEYDVEELQKMSYSKLAGIFKTL